MDQTVRLGIPQTNRSVVLTFRVGPPARDPLVLHLRSTFPPRYTEVAADATCPCGKNTAKPLASDVRRCDVTDDMKQKGVGPPPHAGLAGPNAGLSVSGLSESSRQEFAERNDLQILNSHQT